PGHHRASFRRRHVASQDPHGGGLSGAVRSQEPEYFFLFHAKADVVHGGDAPVALRDVLNLDHTVTPLRNTRGLEPKTCRPSVKFSFKTVPASRGVIKLVRSPERLLLDEGLLSRSFEAGCAALAAGSVPAA